MNENISKQQPPPNAGKVFAAGFLALAVLVLFFWQFLLFSIAALPNRGLSSDQLLASQENLAVLASLALVLVFVFMILAIIAVLFAIPRTE